MGTLVARRSVAIFGSVAGGDEGPGSDIDLLVELEPGVRPFELLVLGAELAEVLAVKVDVGTPECLRAVRSAHPVAGTVGHRRSVGGRQPLGSGPIRPSARPAT